MLEELVSHFTTMPENVDGNDFHSRTKDIFTGLTDEVIPTLEKLNKDIPSEKVVDNQLLHNVRLFGVVKAKDNKDVIKKVLDVFIIIGHEERNVLKLVKEIVTDVITDKTVSAKQTAIMKIVEDINGMNQFVLDFMYKVLLGDDETNFPKSKFKNLNEAIGSFNSALSVYGSNFRDMLARVERMGEIDTLKIEESRIVNNGTSSMIEKLLFKSGSFALPATNGFINNPIYHIGMWFVDNEVSSADVLREKRKLVELKLSELKHDPDANSKEMKNRIKYYEDKISKMEYDIADLES